MKLRNKIAAITAAAMLAFTGVGFAAWTFNKDVTDFKNATIQVLSESEEGTLTLDATDLYIILDQAGISYASDVAGANPVTQLTGVYNAVADGTLGENMDVTFSLAFSGATSDWSHYVEGLVNPANQTITMVHGDNNIAFDLPALSYVVANKPSTESEYDAMVTALNGKQLTLTVTADAAADTVVD